jgi:hypothetical protein
LASNLQFAQIDCANQQADAHQVMAASDPSPIVLHADQEHSGIRVTVLLVLVVTIWPSFLLARLLLSSLFPQSDYLGILSCIGALPLALALVWAVEQWLKRVWPSGRQLTIVEGTIKATEPGREDKVLKLSDNLTHLSWYFRLGEYARGGHERRVPKQWLCLSSQLQQDEQRLVVYTYMSVNKAASLIQDGNPYFGFQQIFPGEVYDTSFRSRIGPPSRPKIPASMLAGSDGQFWLAERRRWAEGFELSPDDFKTLVQFVYDYRIEDDDPLP